MTTTTNISDLNNASGLHRLSVIKGGLGNTGSISAGVVYGVSSNTFGIQGVPIQNTLFTVIGGTFSNSLGGPVLWVANGSSSTNATVGAGYITTSSSLQSFNLPLSFSVGQKVGIVGEGSGGWKLFAHSGTTIQFGTAATSSGGNLSSTNRYDNCIVIGVVANTTWAVLSSLSSGLTVS